MAATQIIGAPADDPGSATHAANYLCLTRYQAEASGNVTQIKVKLAAGKTSNVKVAIYADSAGSPGSLLNSTSGDACTEGWNTISIASTAITSGTYYWLAVRQDTGLAVHYNNASGTMRYKAFTYTNAWPNPAGAGYQAGAFHGLLSGWAITYTTYTRTYTADTLFKKLGLTKTYTADTLLKKTGILQTVDADALIKKLGITRTFLAKAIFGAVNIQELTADALFKAFGLTQTVDVDALLQQQDITQDITADAIINLIATQSVDADAILKAIKTATFTVNVRLGEAGALAFTASVYFKRLAYHVILDAQYITETPEVNRAYVIGRDAEGNPVHGTDLEQAEIDLVGERLDFQQHLSIPTSALAADVADAMLKKQRLSKHRGFITIPPNTGAELWDVIQVTDTPCAQSSSKYRVLAISFDYQPRQRRYQHKLILGAP